MALLPDQPVMISGSTAFDPGARSATARREHEPSRQNAQIADKLRQVADILAAQKADPFRIAAYRRAAESIRVLNDDLGAIAEKGGRDALEAIPFIGTSIASAIAEMLTTGRWHFLEHLKGSASPETLFQALPGIGPALAHRVCETLRLDTIEALEAAAYDGRLEQVRGFGHRRAAMVRAALAEMLARVRRGSLRRDEEPGVDLLLDVDREYREKATAGELVKIAPKRFNPKGEAWLPVLHTVRGTWHFTALYSNTARAHQLERVTDWVVIFSTRTAKRKAGAPWSPKPEAKRRAGGSSEDGSRSAYSITLRVEARFTQASQACPKACLILASNISLDTGLSRKASTPSRSARARVPGSPRPVMTITGNSVAASS